MRTNFGPALMQTLVFEGGYSDNIHDPGGATNFGITQRTYNLQRKSMGRAPQSVKLILPIEREEIYQSGYWALVNGDALPSGPDSVTFDYAVNSGPSRANRAYKACLPCSAVDAVRRISASRLSFMHGLRTWQYFGKGWGRRVAAMELFGLKLAASGGLPTTTPSITDAKVRAKKSTAQSKITGTSAAAPAGAAMHPAVIASGSHWFMYAAVAALVLIAVLMAVEAMHQNSRAQILAQG
jgi:lysozyme family protein